MVGRIGAQAAIGLLLISSIARLTRADAPRDPALDDAQLAGVALVDPQNAWAVGDRGVVWHTADGGQHWELQPSGVDCHLAAVRFLDARHGWAVGGWTKPYTQITAGVVLETRDGGQHWQHDRKLLLPALREIKFFDAHHGWAIGQPSALFPVGVFTTDDGGRSWSALPADDGQCWLSGDFVDPASGVVVGRAAAAATVRRRAIQSRTEDVGLRALQRVRMANPKAGWLVGDGGLVRRTDNAGDTWTAPAGELPTAAAQIDFQALAVRDEHCWMAGTPGTQVLHSPDGGHSWQIRATGQALPIRALSFADEQHGLAVGDFGLILATSDGGQTWQRRRSGGSRAALAAFASQASDVPLELIARLSTEEGYLSVVDVVNRHDLGTRAAAHVDALSAFHDAVVRVGGCAATGAWQFPLREPGLKLSVRQLIDVWNAQLGGRALDELDVYLVRQIRTWRPSVVLVPAAGVQADAQSQLLAQAVLQAVERAAQADQRPEQIELLGLQPWRVDKVFASLAPGESGAVNVSTAQLSVRSGHSLAELAGAARGMIGGNYAVPASSLGFRLLVDRLPQERGARDFFSGIVLSPGGEARRSLLPVSENSLDRVKQTTEARRNLQAILGQANRTGAESGSWLAEVGRFAESLDDESAGELLFQLAQRYYLSGRWDLAAETFEMIGKRYPQHPLAGASLVWLVQYYASSEAAWRMTRTQQINARQVIAVDSEAVGRKGQRIADVPPPQIVASGGLLSAVDRPDRWPARASACAKMLEQADAALFVEPRARFPLAVAETRQGLTRQAERFYLAARRSRSGDSWGACAAAEGWLARRDGNRPKEVASCVRAESKPRLDGRLDEALWQQALPLELHSPAGDDQAWSAAAKLAYDDEFLYFAASCRRPPDAPSAAASKKIRQRDADLAAHDRIELSLDLDRDWTTYYRLSVDARGVTHDECWHDASWNPQWFVAAAEADGAWTIEAAIPLAELARQFPNDSQAWALGITRIVPGVGVQSWSKPAAVEQPGEAFGLLIFE